MTTRTCCKKELVDFFTYSNNISMKNVSVTNAEL